MGKQFFYASGETIEAVVRETESHPECRFTYTPLTRGEYAECEDRIRKGNAVAIAQLIAETIRRHVKSWNVTKQDGSGVDPRNTEETNRLVPQLGADVFEVIYKSSEGDRPSIAESLDEAEPASAEGDLGNC